MKGEGPVGGAGDEAGGERVAVAVGVVGQDAGGPFVGAVVDVFVNGVAVGGGAGGVVHDAERGGRHTAVIGAVVGLVREAVAADEMRCGVVGEAAVGIEGQRAVGNAGHEDGGERAAPHVHVVGENAGRGAGGQRVVVRDRVAVVDGDGGEEQLPLLQHLDGAGQEVQGGAGGIGAAEATHGSSAEAISGE